MSFRPKEQPVQADNIKVSEPSISPELKVLKEIRSGLLSLDDYYDEYGMICLRVNDIDNLMERLERKYES